MSLLGGIVGALGPFLGVLGMFLLAAALLSFAFHYATLSGAGGLARVQRRLEKHGSLRDDYLQRLWLALEWVDGKLGEKPLSAKSYDFALRPAFVYPIASMMIFWAVSSENTSGIPGMLPENIVWWVRSLALGVIVGSGAFTYRATQTSTWRGLAYLAGAVIFVLVFAYVGGLTGAVAVVGANAAPDAFADAFVVAFPSAFALAIAFVGAGLGAGYGAGAFSSVLIAVVAIALVDANFGAGVVIAFLVVVAFCIAFVFAFNYLQEFMKHRNKQGLFYGCYILFIFIFLYIFVYYEQFLQKYIEVWRIATTFLIFFVILPIINSIFDWFSMGFTRGLLRYIADGKYGIWYIALNTLFNALIGVVLLIALAVTCTVALQTLNLLSQANGGREFYDLARMFGRLRNDPGNPAAWWIYATLLSTMLPTLAHVVFAASTAVTWNLPASWRRYMQDLVNPNNYPLKDKFLKKDFPLRLSVASLLTLLDAVALMLAAVFCLALYGLVWALPGLGQGLLWLCENVARGLGAPL